MTSSTLGLLNPAGQAKATRPVMPAKDMAARVRASVAKDLTHYIGPELERRVNEVLQLPNGHQPK